jgi:hypothetical protein
MGMTKGTDTNGDDLIDGAVDTRQVELDRDHPLSLTFAPRTGTIVNLKLISKGTPYWGRPDLGIGRDDVVIQDRRITVTVHSLGALDAAATRLALMDAHGKMMATVPVPPLKAPLDLLPKTTSVTFTVPAGASVKGGSVVLDPDVTMKEITRSNNQVKLN